MQTAIGRLQFSITMTTPASAASVEEDRSADVDVIERAYRRDRLYREIEADRRRWASKAGDIGTWRR